VIEHVADIVLGVGGEPHDGKCTSGPQPDPAQPERSSSPYFVTKDR
jgi:hypothetical protein